MPPSLLPIAALAAIASDTVAVLVSFSSSSSSSFSPSSSSLPTSVASLEARTVEGGHSLVPAPLPLVPDWTGVLDAEVVAKAAATVPDGCWPWHIRLRSGIEVQDKNSAAWRTARDLAYKECCLGLWNESCWGDDDFGTWRRCCTGEEEIWDGRFHPEENGLPRRILAAPSLPKNLLSCMLEGEDPKDGLGIWKHANETRFGKGWLEFRSTKESSLQANSYTQAIKCVASLPWTSVVLDLLRGAGSTSVAAYQGLMSQRKRPPAEIFSFELWGPAVGRALNLSAGLSQPLRVIRMRGTAATRRLRRLLSSSKPLRVNWTEGLRSGYTPQSGRSVVPILFHGSATINGSLVDYRENALDVLCRHRPSIDVLIFDPPRKLQLHKEWAILEAFCKPKWVFMAQANMAVHAGGWIFNHLLQQPDTWRLQLLGSYTVGGGAWPPHLHLEQIRSWAVFRRVQPPAWS